MRARALVLAAAYPLTIDKRGRELTLEAPPERVLILNGTSIAEVERAIAVGLRLATELAGPQWAQDAMLHGMVGGVAGGDDGVDRGPGPR